MSADKPRDRGEGWKSVPEPDWQPLQTAESEGGRSFVSGEPEGDRLRVRYFKRPADGALVGFAWFGPGAQGPPGFAHGGSVAALIDEATGGAAWLAGHAVLAASLRVDFRSRLPLDTEVFFEAQVTEVDGRKVWARAHVFSPGQRLYAEGENLLVCVDPGELGSEYEQVAERLWRPIPPTSHDAER